jgi:hypothetical protein
MKWKEYGRKWSEPKFMVLSQHWPGENEYTTYPGRDLNPRSTEYEAERLTTTPQIW